MCLPATFYYCFVFSACGVTHTIKQNCASFDKFLSLEMAYSSIIEDFLAGLTGSSTQAGTDCADIQLIGNSVADCQALAWPNF